MSKAYLTIDDTSSRITPNIMDYLNQKNITPIMFSVGK
ncbi:MAG: polysaccharide deacetylase family protein, partial [Ruminiclostridium sp.]